MLRSLFLAPKGDRPVLALSLLGGGIVLLSLQDALIKMLSSDVSFWQLQFVRSILNIGFLLCIAYFSGGLKELKPKRARFVFFRAVLLAITMVCLFGASPSLSFSQMASGLYTYPLFITALSIPILGERIGIWRLSAVLIGVVGAFILLDPLAEDFTLLQVLPIFSGLFYALNVMTIRGACRYETPLALSVMTAGVFLFSGIVGIILLHILPIPNSWQQTMSFITIPWLPFTWGLLVFIMGVSALNVLGNLLNARAYQSAESSVLAPLDFCYLIFAAFWGRVMFAEHLSVQEYAGMALIAAAGIVITLREQYRKKAL